MSRYTSALKDPSVVSNVAIGLDIAVLRASRMPFGRRALGRRVSERIGGRLWKLKRETNELKLPRGEKIFVTLSARRKKKNLSLSLSRACRRVTSSINESIT